MSDGFSANRRAFLRTTGLLGMSATMLGGAGLSAQATPEDDARRSGEGTSAAARPADVENPRFTLAVVPDTQYLFDRDRGDREPLEATFEHVLEQAREHNIVFLAHLGDVTENGLPDEVAEADRAFRVLDRKRFPYSVLAGNHDINSRTDDQRGRSPYLDAFGPKRFEHSPTFRGASPGGYNSYHVFRAGGREWLLLALDWRVSAVGYTWVRQVLDKHPGLPVILTTHELVHADGGTGEAELSAAGKLMWDKLIAGEDRIFLTLNGHFWPPGRTTLRNKAGNEVHLHITNYQDRYYGGGAMLRLYHFDLARNVIDVETVAPWLLRRRPERLNVLEQQEIRRTGAADRFTVEIDFTERFRRFAPPPVRPARPAAEVVIPGTVAYWRFEDAERFADLSGNGNHLTRATLPGAPSDALSHSEEHHPDQPGHGSLRMHGGGYLRTAADAPLTKLTFPRGYTIEAFVKLPKDFDHRHAWCGLLTTVATGADAGKTGDDPREPLATLNLSDGAAFQWAAFPRNQEGLSTNWGHELPRAHWWHVAVVNDGRRSVLHVEGAPVLRNPDTPAVGIPAAVGGWLVGAYAYDRKVEKSFTGWLGDLRIVDRPLRREEFLTGR
ncbi:Tat pathway signal sequence domain protein [Crossiella sp. CA-258035]|uniref:LamG-like jellyroll fold domain-containing protein n=1 Tax=Crossiella sp. CA-258035 TaxID=2981138 RepID=UPI0024BC6034|nr:LamG-like jellyroll fold domain-containing protein [Crossiella sp. CA-258035]WHT22085.1 Tat pathway signal sequence domain protein [Crossiella sp. CA-258035]